MFGCEPYVLTKETRLEQEKAITMAAFDGVGCLLGSVGFFCYYCSVKVRYWRRACCSFRNCVSCLSSDLFEPFCACTAAWATWCSSKSMFPPSRVTGFDTSVMEDVASEGILLIEFSTSWMELCTDTLSRTGINWSRSRSCIEDTESATSETLKGSLAWIVWSSWITVCVLVVQQINDDQGKLINIVALKIHDMPEVRNILI